MPTLEMTNHVSWKEKLKKELAAITGEVIFVGHSCGRCQIPIPVSL